MSYRSYIVGLIITGLLFIFSTHSVSAAYFFFTPSTKTAAVGELMQVDIGVDATAEQIIGADAYIEFDNTKFSIQSIQTRSFFPYVTHTISTNRLAIRGLVLDSSSFVTGTGTIATVTLQVLNAQAKQLTFYCDTASTSTSRITKNDITATNIIDCTKNGVFTINVSGTVPTPTTPINIPTATPPICLLKNRGDADCNGAIQLADFEAWRKEFSQEAFTRKADFDNNFAISLADFEIWRKNFF